LAWAIKVSFINIIQHVIPIFKVAAIS